MASEPKNKGPILKALDKVRNAPTLASEALAKRSGQNTRPAPVATDTGLETVAKLGGINGVMLLRHIENLRPKAQAAYKDELVRRSQADALLAAKDQLIQSLNIVVDNFKSRTNTLKADNAAKDARVKELEETIRMHAVWNYPKDIQDLCVRAEALETQLAAAEKALEPFANVAEHDIGGDEDDGDIFWPMSNARYSMAGRLRVGDLRRARAVLGGR